MEGGDDIIEARVEHEALPISRRTGEIEGKWEGKMGDRER